jgi:hypothetical protein
MGSPVTTAAFEVNCVHHAPTTALLDGVARLIRSFENRTLTTAILEHFRHKWETIQHSVLIERSKNVFSALHTDGFAHA